MEFDEVCFFVSTILTIYHSEYITLQCQSSGTPKTVTACC